MSETPPGEARHASIDTAILRDKQAIHSRVPRLRLRGLFLAPVADIPTAVYAAGRPLTHSIVKVRSWGDTSLTPWIRALAPDHVEKGRSHRGDPISR
jgi:hypothetical protein